VTARATNAAAITIDERTGLKRVPLCDTHRPISTTTDAPVSSDAAAIRPAAAAAPAVWTIIPANSVQPAFRLASIMPNISCAGDGVVSSIAGTRSVKRVAARLASTPDAATAHGDWVSHQPGRYRHPSSYRGRFRRQNATFTWDSAAQQEVRTEQHERARNHRERNLARRRSDHGFPRKQGALLARGYECDRSRSEERDRRASPPGSASCARRFRIE
jgi:hypothetical protein